MPVSAESRSPPIKNLPPPKPMFAQGTSNRRQVRRAAAGFNKSPEPTPVGAGRSASRSRFSVRRGSAFYVMPEETKRSSRIRRVGLVVLILGVLGFAYPTLYYRTTTLTVGKPYLDWYAYREFSSRTHYILFLPCFTGRGITTEEIPATFAGQDCDKMITLGHNKSLQATRDGRFSSAVAEDVTNPARLSSGR